MAVFKPGISAGPDGRGDRATNSTRISSRKLQISDRSIPILPRSPNHGVRPVRVIARSTILALSFPHSERLRRLVINGTPSAEVRRARGRSETTVAGDGGILVGPATYRGLYFCRPPEWSRHYEILGLPTELRRPG
jgi:hypothetical protein